MLTVRAPAKINLTLEVMGRYDDGYHQIASVMQAIDLCDTLSFETSDQLQLRCNIPQLALSDNLVFRAARLLQETTSSNQGALISLEKAIPLNSGLGGGSSDAAATLKALNGLWKLGLTVQQLKELSQRLGSDIPFFLDGNTALVEGRGEKATPLPPLPGCWVVLLKPPFDAVDKTKRMYERIEAVHFTSGEFTRGMVKSLERGEKSVLSLCYNVFEQVAFSFFSGLEEYRRRFLAAGATAVHVAGAGPTLFSLVEGRAQGEEIRSRLRGEVYLVQTIG